MPPVDDVVMGDTDSSLPAQREAEEGEIVDNPTGACYINFIPFYINVPFTHVAVSPLSSPLPDLTQASHPSPSPEPLASLPPSQLAASPQLTPAAPSRRRPSSKAKLAGEAKPTRTTRTNASKDDGKGMSVLNC